jgi:hypothetical protein
LVGDLSEVITAFAVLGILVLIMRWTFRPSRPRGSGPLLDASDSSELGLLDVVATGLQRQVALGVRAALTEAGIRSSISRRRNGDVDVLVFHADADRARRVLKG